MHSCNGLKRSMPCNDLISLGIPSKERGLSLETDRFFDESARQFLRSTEVKRQRLSTMCLREEYNNTSNPATAALEEALALDGQTAIELETLNISFLASIASDFAFSDLKSNRPCKEHKNLLSPVHTVHDMTHILARMTTSA